MSKALHGGFSGTHGTDSDIHNFADNLPKLTKKYPLSPAGYFGKPGKGDARLIESESPLKTAKDFYSMATNGAEARKPLLDKNKKPLPGSEIAIMKDKSRIQIRPVSHSDGSPAVDICIVHSGMVKKQKIHFIKGEKK